MECHIRLKYVHICTSHTFCHTLHFSLSYHAVLFKIFDFEGQLRSFRSIYEDDISVKNCNHMLEHPAKYTLREHVKKQRKLENGKDTFCKVTE